MQVTGSILLLEGSEAITIKTCIARKEWKSSNFSLDLRTWFAVICISTDGFKSELKVMDVHSLFNAAIQLFQDYNAAKHLYYMGAFKDSYMTEHQFAQFLGKCRLYQYLPTEQKRMLPQMLMTDTQIGIVAKSFYNDDNFSLPDNQGEISMWNVYNLLTGANKTSYIDNFLDRAYNATQLADGLNKALYGDSEYAWFIQ